MILGDPMSKTGKSNELVNEISLGGNEQLVSIKSLNAAIQQLSDITNINSATAEEMSASSEELFTQARTLQGLIKSINIEQV